MNNALRFPGEGLALNWEWLGLVVAMRRVTSMSSCSFCTGQNSEVSLAPLMCFSCSLAQLSLYQLRSGFSGEGKHISVVGSSGCLLWGSHEQEKQL